MIVWGVTLTRPVKSCTYMAEPRTRKRQTSSFTMMSPESPKKSLGPNMWGDMLNWP